MAAAARNFYLFDIGGFCSIFFTPFHWKCWWLNSWLSSPDLLLTPQIARITLRGLPDSWDKWENLLFVCSKKCEKFWSAFLNSFLVRMRKTLSQKKWAEMAKKVHWLHHILALRRKFTYKLISVTYILWKDTETTSSLQNEIFTLPKNEPLFPPRCIAECCCHREWLPRASESSPSSSLMASHTGTFRVPLWLQFSKTSRDSPSAPCEEFKIEISLSCYFYLR